jgi:hypothetical protein
MEGKTNVSDSTGVGRTKPRLFDGSAPAALTVRTNNQNKQSLNTPNAKSALHIQPESESIKNVCFNNYTRDSLLCVGRSLAVERRAVGAALISSQWML